MHTFYIRARGQGLTALLSGLRKQTVFAIVLESITSNTSLALPQGYEGEADHHLLTRAPH
jgi:hypothetical protein